MNQIVDLPIALLAGNAALRRWRLHNNFDKRLTAQRRRQRQRYRQWRLRHRQQRQRQSCRRLRQRKDLVKLHRRFVSIIAIAIAIIVVVGGGRGGIAALGGE
jgi:hypothetical protein